MYRGNSSIVKDNVRDLLYREIKSNWKEGRRKTSLTLCNTSFELEKKLLQHGNVVCVEKDKDVYKIALKTAPPSIKVYNEDLFLYKHKSSYDFIWVDLCNSYSEEILKNVIELIKTIKLNKDAVFAITFIKNRGFINKSKIVEFYPQFKEKGLINYLGNFFDKDIKEAKRIDYNCFDLSTRAAPMSLFIFKF